MASASRPLPVAQNQREIERKREKRESERAGERESERAGEREREGGERERVYQVGDSLSSVLFMCLLVSVCATVCGSPYTPTYTTTLAENFLCQQPTKTVRKARLTPAASLPPRDPCTFTACRATNLRKRVKTDAAVGNLSAAAVAQPKTGGRWMGGWKSQTEEVW
jgi:hypothetical protein